MSARLALKDISYSTVDGPMRHTTLTAMTDADRIALARALVPDGWVVGRVPPREGSGAGGQTNWQMGFNACRAAILASSEEAP